MMGALMMTMIKTAELGGALVVNVISWEPFEGQNMRTVNSLKSPWVSQCPPNEIPEKLAPYQAPEAGPESIYGCEGSGWQRGQPS